MNHKLRRVVTLSIIVLMFSVAAIASSKGGAEEAFLSATDLACTQRAVPVQCQILQFSRTELDHNVVYYKALIKVGGGDYDVIAVSRLIREAESGNAVHTVGSFMFLHGSSETFHQVMISLNGGLGVFLAERNIDVWGLDLRNVQIPGIVTDLSFARNWGLDVQVNDTLLATRIARLVRGLTGQGGGGVILGGHSSGGTLTFAAANAEAAMPASDRDVAGIIPIDATYKLPPDATPQIEFVCNASALYRSFVNDNGLFFFDNTSSINMGRLAQTDPDGVSPSAAPLTNRQLLLENASALFFDPVFPFHPFAVVRDDLGIATAGRYSSYADILETFIDAPVYPIPNAMMADMLGVSCPALDGPYSANLAAIDVPVLYVDAAGGFGRIAEYTTQLLGSQDVTVIRMQALPDAEARNDFGHMEPFTAYQSKDLVWQPIHAWIVKHSK